MQRRLGNTFFPSLDTQYYGILYTTDQEVQPSKSLISCISTVAAFRSLLSIRGYSMSTIRYRELALTDGEPAYQTRDSPAYSYRIPNRPFPTAGHLSHHAILGRCRTSMIVLPCHPSFLLPTCFCTMALLASRFPAALRVANRRYPALTPRGILLGCEQHRSLSCTPRWQIRTKEMNDELIRDLRVNQGRLMEVIHHTCQWGTGERWGE
jgi:hypothetical protein